MAEVANTGCPNGCRAPKAYFPRPGPPVPVGSVSVRDPYPPRPKLDSSHMGTVQVLPASGNCARAGDVVTGQAILDPVGLIPKGGMIAAA